MGYFDGFSGDDFEGVGEYLSRTEKPAQAADKPWYNDAYEVARQGAAGLVVDAPRMVGQALRWMAPDGSVIDEAGRSAVDAADARAPGWAPDMEGRGLLAETLIKGSRAVGPMVGAIGATMLGGPVAGGAVAAGQFGMGSAQDTEDKLRNEGIPYEDANAAARRVGLIQGPLEGVATAVGAKAFQGAMPLLGIGGQTTGSVAARLTDTAVLKPLAKGMGLNLLVQPTTEVAQDVGTEMVERSYGAKPEDAWAIAKDSAQGGVGLTLLLGPFAAGGQIQRAGRAEQLKRALYDPATPEAVRAQARDMVVEAAATEGVAPENADAWLDEQFMADDARSAEEQARESAYIQNRAQQMFDGQGDVLKRQNRQDRREIRDLMQPRPTASPLGQVAPSPTAGFVGTSAVTEAMEAQQVAQQRREAAAQVQQQAAMEAQAQKSPEQLAKEQAQAQTVVLNQQAMAVAQQEGVAETKGAAQVIKEMLRASDAVSPELSGQIIGELQSGDVSSARKILDRAVKAQQKAQQDTIKEAQALAKMEAEQQKLADDVVATRTSTPTPQGAPANVPSPAQPGTQTSQAPSAQGAAPSPAQPVEDSTGNLSDEDVQRASWAASPVSRRTRVLQRAGASENAAQNLAALDWDSLPAGSKQAFTASSEVAAPVAVAPLPTLKAAPLRDPSKSPGQNMVTFFEAQVGKKMSDVTRRRLYLRVGFDEQGYPSASGKMTLEQVAAAEAALSGKAKGVQREAIRKDLARFKITDAVANAMSERDYTAAADLDNAQESDSDPKGVRVNFDEDLGEGELRETSAPETTTIGNVEGDFDSEAPMVGRFDTGLDKAEMAPDGTGNLRVKTNLGSAGIEKNITKSRQAYTLLDAAKAKRAQTLGGPVKPNSDEASMIEALDKLIEIDSTITERERPGTGKQAGEIFGISDAKIAAINRHANVVADYYYSKGDLEAASVFASGRLVQAIDGRLEAASDAKGAASPEARTKEAEQAARNAEIIAANQREINELEAGRQKIEGLRGLLPDNTLDTDIDDAAESWAEYAEKTKNAPSWHDLSLSEQAQWIKSTIARYTDQLSEKNYAGQFDRIEGNARVRLQQAAKAAGAPGADDAGQRAGPTAGAEPTDRAGGSTQKAGAAEPTTQGDAPGDGGAAQPAQVVVGDGTKSSATVVAKKKRRVVQPAEGARFSRGAVPLGSLKDKVGQQVAVIETTLADMERTPHIKAAFDRFRKDGLGHVVDSVESWYVTENPVEWGGAYTVVNGKTAIVMSSHDMLVPSAGEFTMLHELGHAADMVHESGGGWYSGMPEMNLRIVGDEVVAHGVVASQVVYFYKNNPNSWFSKRLAYPLDRARHDNLNAQGVREEMFAQLHATFNTPVGKEFLYDNMPDVAFFLENTNADIAKNGPAAEGVSGSTNGAAPSRFNQTARQGRASQGPGVLASRSEGDRGQRASEVTDTPAFKRWFGDSKVVGADGKPLVVYHGTQADLTQFTSAADRGVGLQAGTYFTSVPELANEYGRDGAVYPVYLSIKNPFDLYDNRELVGWKGALARTLFPKFARQIEADQKMRGGMTESLITVRDREALQKAGYDGIKASGGVWIAFNPEQVKSATGNNGQFDGTNPDIRFSRSTPFPRTPKVGTVQRAIARLPKPAQMPVRNSVATLGDWANKGLDRVVFTGDLIDRAAKAGLTSAKTLERILGKRANTVRELEREVERIADMYALVPEVDRGDGPKSLNQFLFDSTRTGQWGYGPNADLEMSQRFDALKPESQTLVRAIFDHGDKVLAQKKKAVLDHTASEYDALIAYGRANPDSMSKQEMQKLVVDKKADLARFKSLFALREGKPYAPIKRMGTHAVIAKSPEYRAAQDAGDTAEMRRLEQDADHYHVSFVEGKNEGRVLMERLKQQGFFGVDDSAVELIERDNFTENLYGGDSMLAALTKLRSQVDAKVADGDKDAVKAAVKMRTMVSELYLEALAEGSARKSEMRRRGVAGEVDMLRSFTAQGRADATFMASVEANPQVQETLQKMRQESRRGGDTTRKSELYKELMLRYLGSLEIDRSPLLNKLTRLTSIWFLATSPGYYLQNLTQPWMMSVPAMAGAHGYGKASGALWTAYGELGPVMKSAKLFSQQFNFDEVPADVREAIKELANRGRIDIGLETEMGEFKVGGDGALTDGWNKVDKGMRMAVQKVESINRLSTAMAAYRLSLADGKTHEQAVDYADRILSDTHGNYDRFSAPRAFNSKVGKVMLQFRKFQLVQLSFYAKLIRDAFQGNDRAVALKTLAYSLSHTGVMAGVMGLPGYAAVAAIMGALAGDDDEKFDLTASLRKFIGDEQLATMILRGAPTLGGTGVDLSGKIGAGNMLSVMPFSNADMTTSSGFTEMVGTLLGGASVGLMARVADGMGLMMGGDWYKGIERSMPKGISDAMVAYRTYNDGMTRRNGDVILPAEDVSEVEGLIKLLGFAPAEQSVVYERRDRAFKTEEMFKDRSTRIKNDFIKAVKAGDSGARTEAMDAWRSLQETRRKTGYKVQPMSDLIKAPQEQAKRERNTVGGVQFNRSNREFARGLAAE